MLTLVKFSLFGFNRWTNTNIQWISTFENQMEKQPWLALSGNFYLHRNNFNPLVLNVVVGLRSIQSNPSKAS